MELCDLVEKCKFYQKHQGSQDELMSLLVSRYCQSEKYGKCNIRDGILKGSEKAVKTASA